MSSGNEAKSTVDREKQEAAQKNALKVPVDALIGFLDRANPKSHCSFCKVGEYGVMSAPEGGTAGVVAAPVPNSKTLGIWLYFATCTTCGHTVFFNAPFVMHKMQDEQK
jgi:hypothetical protein